MTEDPDPEREQRHARERQRERTERVRGHAGRGREDARRTQVPSDQRDVGELDESVTDDESNVNAN
ncbi:hypothetical protein [Halorussus lipolyticus]|uniref:hypothetical protein n=1 Tax=Halorussus lipolyticus TaxID=3034024 RepID=UPI0023E8AA3C|nr:hypothetical protein [Halorussus sp. DT80]